MAWYRMRGVGALLRVGGFGMLAVAYFICIALKSRVGTVELDSDPFAYFLAAASFLCSSLGSILVVLGRHIFDRVEISRRWSRIERK